MESLLYTNLAFNSSSKIEFFWRPADQGMGAGMWNWYKTLGLPCLQVAHFQCPVISSHTFQHCHVPTWPLSPTLCSLAPKRRGDSNKSTQRDKEAKSKKLKWTRYFILSPQSLRVILKPTLLYNSQCLPHTSHSHQASKDSFQSQSPYQPPKLPPSPNYSFLPGEKLPVFKTYHQQSIHQVVST